jgi:polyketide biosynthesis acyl carrier protein
VTAPSWDEVFAVVCDQVTTVLQGVSPSQVRPDISMADLGANSLDRMDVVVASQDKLGIQVPASEFAAIENLGQLVNVLHVHCGQ